MYKVLLVVILSIVSVYSLNSRCIAKMHKLRVRLSRRDAKDQPKSCVGIRSHGVEHVVLPGLKPTSVFCDSKTAGPGWMVIQRRSNGSIDFYRDFEAYSKGFGQLEGEYWMGLKSLYRFTNYRPHKLYIELQKIDGKIYHAHYDNFIVGNEYESYPLNAVGKYSGNAGDRLSQHVNHRFTTHDKDNDDWKKGNSAVRHHGGWWYKYELKHTSNLNGRYYNKIIAHHDGIYWIDKYSLKSVTMLIRPKR